MNADIERLAEAARKADSIETPCRADWPASGARFVVDRRTLKGLPLGRAPRVYSRVAKGF